MVKKPPRKPSRKAAPAPKPLVWRITHMREWREYREITQEGMVERLAHLDPPVIITYPSIGRYERGVQVPTIKTIEAIAKVLNVDTDSMLNHSPSKQRERIVEIIRKAIEQ